MQGRDRLGAEAEPREAEQRHADADMGERPAVERQRQPERALQRDAGRETRPLRAHDDFDQRAENDEDRETRRQRSEDRPAAEPRRAEDCGRRAGDQSQGQPLRDGQQIAALPGEREPEWGDEAGGQQQRAAGQVEEGRADGDLLAGQLLERQRVEGAEQHGRA